MKTSGTDQDSTTESGFTMKMTIGDGAGIIETTQATTITMTHITPFITMIMGTMTVMMATMVTAAAMVAVATAVVAITAVVATAAAATIKNCARASAEV